MWEIQRVPGFSLGIVAIWGVKQEIDDDDGDDDGEEEEYVPLSLCLSNQSFFKKAERTDIYYTLDETFSHNAK